ncbi:MAG TPA: YCF48-related protein [Thermoleophilia bacterium]|nr:YCF48-related protein [Thermoleophilia bacterium]
MRRAAQARVRAARVRVRSALPALALAGLVLGSALVLLGAPGRAAALPQGDAAASSPFLLAAGTGLFEQYGYAPAYTRNVPAFDASGAAYIRSRTSSGSETSYVHTLVDGVWTRFDFLAALRAAYPTFVSTDGAGGLRNDGIVFDRQDRAYNPITVKLRDGSTHGCLLVSWDHCRTWKVFKLPSPTFALEHWVGHNDIDGPPFLAYWKQSAPPDLPGSQTNALYVTQPRLEGDSLALPRPVKVTDRCLGLNRDSGGASFAVTRGDTTWFVWSEVAARGGRGTPQYVATYDHLTGAVGMRHLLATSPSRSDPHCKPGICLDSAGTLHVACGGHNSPVLYTRSLAPLTADGGWTQPVPVLTTGWVAKEDPAVQEGLQTYPSFVCDSRDTLHLITRQWRRGVDPLFEGRQYGALIHQSCPAGGSWSEPDIIVAGAYPGYSVFFHKLALDAHDRLFLSCSYQGGTELDDGRVDEAVEMILGRTSLRPGKYRGRMLLVSEDGGATWRFADDADLAAPAAGAAPQTPAATAVAKAAHAAAPPPSYAWRWLNPSPQGNQYTSVSFFHACGWAVGTHGIVSRSTNGGAFWTRQSAPVGADLFGVAAASRTRAWAVGSGGLILRTDDGGATWSPAVTGTTRDLFGVCAVSAREGWAVGEAGTLLHTADGGRTWTPSKSPTSDTLLGVAFSGRRQGLLCGNRGVLFRTGDAGRTWKLRRSLTNSALLSAALLADGSAAVSGTDGVLLVSSDAGWQWKMARTSTKDTLRAVRLLPDGRMWALGDHTVLRSADGGRHWRRAALPAPGPCGALAVLGRARPGRAAPSGGAPDRAKPGGRKPPPPDPVVVAGGAGGALCRSADGGRTWHAWGRGARDDLYAAAAADGRAVFAGDAGTVLGPGAAGASWPVARVAGGGKLDAVALRGGVTWVAGAGGTVARRAGAGRWRVLPAPTGADLHAVDAPSDHAVVVAGDDGTLLTSADDGRTWTAATGVEDDLFALAFPDGQHGWAGGGAAFGEARADVARSDDGGASWSWSELPAWGRVRGLCFTDPQTGWAAVEDWGVDGDRPQGSVFMTADGGASWVRQLTTGHVLLGVTMAADGTGWAWGEDGTVLRTEDGGVSWRPLDAGTDGSIFAAVAQPAGGVLLAGSGGAIIAGTPTP